MLEQIATEATECVRHMPSPEMVLTCCSNMIDVLHPSNAEIHQRSVSGRGTPDYTSGNTDEVEDEEVAWLQSIQAAGVNDMVAVKGLQSGALVMDIGQLRDEPHPSTPKRSHKGKLPM